MKIIETLIKLGVCSESIRWVEEQPNQELSILWTTCPNGDHLWWLLNRIGYDILKLDASYKVRSQILAKPWSVRAGTYEVWEGARNAAKKQYADDIRKIVSFEEVMELLEKVC